MSRSRLIHPTAAMLVLLLVAMAGLWTGQQWTGTESEATPGAVPGTEPTVPIGVLAPVATGAEAPPLQSAEGDPLPSPVQERRPTAERGEGLLTDPQLVDLSEVLVASADPGALLDPVPDDRTSEPDSEPVTDLRELAPGVRVDLTAMVPRFRDPCVEPTGSHCPVGEPGTIRRPVPLAPPALRPGPATPSDTDTPQDGSEAQAVRVPPQDPGLPRFEIRPVDQSTVLLSAPHRAGDRVQFNVRVLGPEDPGDCSIPGDNLPLADRGESSTTVTVDEAWLRERRYDTAYTRRTTAVVMVPEGTRILACIAVQDRHRPSWEWLNAQRRTWRLLDVPDTPRPAVSIASVSLLGEVEPGAVHVSAIWPHGRGPCRLASGPAEARSTFTAAEHSGRCAGDEFGITGGDLVLRTVARHGRTTTTNRVILPLSHLMCPGCRVPETGWYHVPLRLEPDEVRMCGSGVRAACDPLEGHRSLGLAQVRVDWSAGATNGRSSWHVGPLQRADTDLPLPEHPQLETMRNRVTSFGATVPTSTAPTQVTGRWLMETDRPVDYEVRVLGECWQVAPVTVTGHSEGAKVLEFPGLCPGALYRLEVTLTGSDGATVTYQPSDWLDATFTTPRSRREMYLDYRVEVEQAPGGTPPLYQLQHLGIRVNEVWGTDIPVPPAYCFAGGVYDPPMGSIPIKVPLGEVSEVALEIDVVPMPHGSTDCDPTVADHYPPVTVVADVHIHQWSRIGDRVTLSTPPAGSSPRVEVLGSVTFEIVG